MIRSFADMDRLASQKGPKRLVVLAPEDEEFMLAVPGLEQVRWRRPVLIGDRLTGTSRVTEGRLSASRPGLGILRVAHELRNQRGEVVIVWDGTQFVSTAASVAAGGAS